MNRQWNFYFSGILYGKLFEEDTFSGEIESAGKESPTEAGIDGGNITISLQDPFTGLSKGETRYGEKEDQQIKSLCKRSLTSFFQNRKEYEQHIAAGEETFRTGNNEVFSRRNDGSYIQRQIKFPKDLCQKDGQLYAVLMAGRDYTAVLVLDGMEQETILGQWPAYELHPVSTAVTYRIPTRDGEFLATDVYLPADRQGRVPAVLVRTPYGKADGCEQYYRFAQRGYAVVIQDTRGREDSTGEWLPNYYETEDGDDTLNWIASQEWSDGQAAMTGGSYLGFVQWAAAASGNPHLKALLSSVCAGSPFIDLPRRGGCFISGSMAWNFAMAKQRFRGDLMARDDWDQVLNIRPVGDIPAHVLGHRIPFVDKWIEHPDYDNFWRRSNWLERSTGHVVPALIMSGWFDDNGMGTTEALDLVKAYYPEGTWKAILGPWMHSGNANYDLHGIFMGDQAIRYDMDIICFAWLEHFLRGTDNGIEKTAIVEYYTLGENKWKSAGAWPGASVQIVPWYLGEACVSLSPEQIAGNGENSYRYDPENPAVHIIDMSENELGVPENYTEEEKRADILCYSSEVLKNDLTVTGDITAVLYFSSDCPDTDLFVRITDVDEKGTSIRLADGMIDVKYRNSFEKPEFMKPDTVYEIRIRTTKISNTFKQGHRLRFTITSGAKNFIFPNSNTEKGFDSREAQTANNKIYWGEKYPSRIMLPVEV